jgi:hypothetical protein
MVKPTTRRTNEQREFVKENLDKVVVEDVDRLIECFENSYLKDTGLRSDRQVHLKNLGDGNGVAEVEYKVNPISNGGYWSKTPHPVYIRPRKFFDIKEVGKISYPQRYQSRDIVENEFPELDEESDKFEEKVKEYHEEALEIWRDEVKHRALRESIKLWSHTPLKNLEIDVEYDER